MFTTIRQYRCEASDVPAIAHLVDERFADRLAEEDGFVAYELIDNGSGDLFTVTVFTDREMADRSSELAAQFVREHLADFILERIGASTGEVLVNRARSDVLELVHA